MRSDTPVITPVGKKTTAREWAEELGIFYAPSLVFFDRDGREVFRSEAYLRSFHIQSVMDYVSSGAYRDQPSFQRFIAARADALARQAGSSGLLMRGWQAVIGLGSDLAVRVARLL